MTDEADFVAESIEELLVSLAEGVRDAQRALSDRSAAEGTGRAPQQYHLPYLDFEFRVDMETASTTAGGRPILRVRSRPSTSEASSVSSSISGRLIAVPPTDGVPLPIVDFVTTRLTSGGRKWTVDITARNSAGEVLAGQPIELNLNLQATRRLSGNPALTFGQTRLGTSLLTTDEAGQASTTLEQFFSERTMLVITAEVGGRTHHHTVVAP